MKRYALNDWIVYRRQETSNHPGPGAHDIHPSKRGDNYSYTTDELGQIVRINTDGSASVKGPDGSVYHIGANDPHVRKASWLKRRLMRRRVHQRATAI
ncbi:MAG: hypothetical protein AB3N33_02630 [Puniceicoccaceae bacterium]